MPIVQRLQAHPAVRLLAVVTAPPRPAGRGRHERRSPVAEWADVAGLPTLAPRRLRSPDSITALAALTPELLVLADYGQLVPQQVLDLPGHGALNLHPSLLPRHRGATPIPAAILAGDRETGVSLMRMDTGLDTGPLIARAASPIEPDETAPQLEARMATLAAGLLDRSLRGWLTGELRATPQAATGATVTRPLRRADGRLDPAVPAEHLVRQVRAYQPWPGSFLDTARGRLVVWRATTSDPVAAHGTVDRPGMLVSRPDGGLGLTTTDGLVELLEVQPAGGRRMAGGEFRRGHPALIGTALRPSHDES